MRERMPAGFSLVETLIALVLTMMVTSTALSLAMPVSRAATTQPEVMDVQQRARVAAEMIARDLASAGAGFVSDPSRGVLPLTIPAVLPRRLGADRGDGPDIARSTAVTMLTVPAVTAETTIAAPIGAGSLLLTVNDAPSCGGAVLCGLSAGDDVLVSDSAGHFDVFRVAAVNGSAATLRHHGQDLAWTYPSGASVSRVVSRTFDFDAAAAQLRQYDGDRSDQPAVDGVANLSFSYWGAATGGGSGLAQIPLSALTDGPWVGSGTTRFDADLLSVRTIRVTVIAQAMDVNLRDRVPPFSVTLDVTPRSLSVGR